MINYKKCPLKKRPVTYKEPEVELRKEPELPLEDGNEQPQDLSMKRKAEDQIESYPKRLPLNLTVSLPYKPSEFGNHYSYSRLDSPLSISSETSQHSNSDHSPSAPIQDNIHLRGFTPTGNSHTTSYLSYGPMVAVWNGHPIYNSPVHSSSYNYHRMTPPSSPNSSCCSLYTSTSEPEDLSIRNDIPLPALFHVFEEAPSDVAQSTVISRSYRFKCDKCSKMYSTSIGLSKHQQYHCPAAECNQQKKQHACQECGKLYTTLGALKMHIRTHTLPCKCPICGKAFSRPWLLQGHIRTHTGEKPFSCSDCHRSFADRSNLRAHQQTHVDVKKYACKVCHKSFSRMSLLNKHANSNCTITIA